VLGDEVQKFRTSGTDRGGVVEASESTSSTNLTLLCFLLMLMAAKVETSGVSRFT
jgi:hypothetical protein